MPKLCTSRVACLLLIFDRQHTYTPKRQSHSITFAPDLSSVDFCFVSSMLRALTNSAHAGNNGARRVKSNQMEQNAADKTKSLESCFDTKSRMCRQRTNLIEVFTRMKWAKKRNQFWWALLLYTHHVCQWLCLFCECVWDNRWKCNCFFSISVMHSALHSPSD